MINARIEHIIAPKTTKKPALFESGFLVYDTVVYDSLLKSF